MRVNNAEIRLDNATMNNMRQPCQQNLWGVTQARLEAEAKAAEEAAQMKAKIADMEEAMQMAAIRAEAEKAALAAQVLEEDCCKPFNDNGLHLYVLVLPVIREMDSVALSNTEWIG